jgi:hypothetical protein
LKDSYYKPFSPLNFSIGVGRSRRYQIEQKF